MKIRFTNHAQAGMLERGISASRISNTLRHPDARFQEHDGAFGCTKAFGSKTLEVIFRKRGNDEYVIITSFYL